MAIDPKPLFACDIDPDGTLHLVHGLTADPRNAARYRWLHFDLRDDGVTDWLTMHLPGTAAQSLRALETRPRVDATGDGLIVTFRGINLNDGANLADMVALRLWVTDRLIVSVRRRRIYALDDIRADCNAGHAPRSPADFLARLADRLVERIETVSLDLESRTDDMEETVYDNGTSTLPGLATDRRMVIKLRRHVGPMTDALHRLSELQTPILPKPVRARLHETANRATRSVEELAEVRERLGALTDHLDLQQSMRLNRNGYILSVIAAIFLPLGFLTGVFGVNLGGIPGQDNPQAFQWFLGGLAALGVVLFGVLRWRRWL